jgi:hypothetical protein
MRALTALVLGTLTLALAAPETTPLAASPDRARARAAALETPDSRAGVQIYIDGLLPSGRTLVGARPDAQPLTGPQAACANCHRRSGLGGQEGRSVIPPVTAQYLFHPRAGSAGESSLPYVPGARPDRDPYTDETLARAIREGVDSEGRSMSVLMPRYALDDADMAALLAHLKTLYRRRVPGVSDTELHFATIITPDADPVQRRAMLDVMQHFVADRNNSQRLPSAQNMLNSDRTLIVKGMFKVTRHWVLHVWEPTGAKSSWTAQLERMMADQPVFAVLSGLGGPDWAPVQAFCEEAAVPCLFPNVDLPPPGADHAFYSLYFSRGVLLEGDLIARQLQPPDGAPRVREVRQVFRRGDIGEAAAAALAQTLTAAGVRVANRLIAPGAQGGAVAAAVRGMAPDEALVLWLRAPDLSHLQSLPAGPLYLSGSMSDVDEQPLPAAWAERARIAYPFDLPDSRRVRVDYGFGWFRIRNIEITAARVQSDTYLACGLASETIKHMVDTFVPDYLVERLEDTVEHRILTGYFPRLTLGPRQRFASKGGYLVHVDPARHDLLADGPWLTP